MVGKCYLAKEATNIVNYAYASAVTVMTPIYVGLLGVLIPIASAGAAASAAYYNKGTFNFCVTSSVAVAVGDIVYYDASTDKVVLIPNTNTFPLGKALTAGTGDSGGTVYVEVEINNLDEMREKVVTLTNAQLRTLNATPVDVIAAPGTGKFILVESVLGKLNYATAAFDSVGSGDDLTLKYTNGSGATAATLETTGWLDQTADTYKYSRSAIDVVPVANAKVVAHIATGEIYGSAGGGTVTLKIRYRIVSM